MRGRALVSRIHERLLRKRRQERGRLKLSWRPGEDPALRIGRPHEAFDIAETLLKPVSHRMEEYWAAYAVMPMAGLLYAASCCGNGAGATWVWLAAAGADVEMAARMPAGKTRSKSAWLEAAEICRAKVPSLADALVRVDGMDSRQREVVRCVIREAIAPYGGSQAR